MSPTGVALRARDWDAYCGQEDLKRKLDVFIRAAVRDKKLLDPVLLTGPPGYGKTTLAAIIAEQLGDPFVSILAPVKMRVLANTFREHEGGVLFIDEIHRFKTDQEALLTVIEDGYLQLDNGRVIPTDHVTVIGATTEPHKIIPPLWDRFLIKPTFVDYTPAEMSEIVLGMAAAAELLLDDGVAEVLGQATGGTPRVAESIIVAANALYPPGTIIQEWMVDAVLDQAGFDRDGLSDDHRQYLQVLKDFGGTAGLRNIMSMLRQPQPTVENLERLLIKKGLLLLEPSGRSLTQAGFAKVAGTRTREVRTRRDPKVA